MQACAQRELCLGGPAASSLRREAIAAPRRRRGIGAGVGRRSALGKHGVQPRSSNTMHADPPLAPASDGLRNGFWGGIESLVWEGSEAQAMEASGNEEHLHPWQSLNPSWKVILLSDGSVTRHLQLLTGLPVSVECIEMRDIGRDISGLPKDVEQLQGDIVQRQVFLRTGSIAKVQVYAASWWNKDEVPVPHLLCMQPSPGVALSGAWPKQTCTVIFIFIWGGKGLFS
mmetsp:Transcript_9447/g.26959  ORF Transcript_9447/g.26959 Transcript_9447/m.26959 type:complete len:228 (+) Transcript_9447:185-868(+)